MPFYHDNYTQLSQVAFIIHAACHRCICSNDCFHSNTNGCWCGPWELLHGFVVLFTRHSSGWWISRTIYDCIKTCSYLQAKRVVLFSCMGLYNTICCFKDSTFIVGIFYLDIPLLLRHWLQPRDWKVSPWWDLYGLVESTTFEDAFVSRI